MASVMAIISKAVFEKSSPGAGLGDVLDTSRYHSTHAALSPLAEGGDLYLVTVRPPDERLWLVGVLRKPKKDAKGWAAAENQAPVRDISDLRGTLRFSNGKGMSAKKGALGMSLQTPRTLTDEDVAALEKALGGKAKAVKTAASKKTVPKKTVPKKNAPKKTVPKKTAPKKTAPKQAAPKKKEPEKTAPKAKRAPFLDFAGLSTTALQEAVIALETKKADPAIAEALVALLERPPYTSRSMTPMWRSVFAQLAGKQAFADNVARLRALRVEKAFGGTNMGGWMKTQVKGLVATLVAQFPDAAKAAPKKPASSPKAGPSDEASGGAKTGSEAELLAMIAARPDDDGPRLVYGDYVAERGDAARAELIQLQVARGKGGVPSEREEALLKKHAKKWLEPIVPVLLEDSWVFERGFLDRCTIYPRKAHALELAGHPLWATVREAKLSETGDPAPIITHPVMQSLRVVHMWTYPRGLQGLLESDAPVEEIHDLYLPNVKRDKKLWSTFVGCKGLPSLRLLKVSGATLETAAELWSGAIARSGMQIFQRVDAAWRLTEWIAALAESRPEHFSLTLFTDHIDVAFEGDSLVITLGPHALDALEEAASALDALGKKDGLSEGQLSRVRLRLPKGGVKGSYPHEKPATAKAMLGAIESICAKRKCPLVIEEGDFDLAYPREARPRYS